MSVHALQAAKAGALQASLTAVLVAMAIGAVSAWQADGSWSEAFFAASLSLLPVALLTGALFGAVGFGLIGLVAALLGIKRVGWTFYYAVTGALLAGGVALFLQPLIESVSDMFIGPAGIAAAVALATAAGCLAGALVSVQLKAMPTP